MKWIEEKQALYRRNQELVEKVRSASRESSSHTLCSQELSSGQRSSEGPQRRPTRCCVSGLT